MSTTALAVYNFLSKRRRFQAVLQQSTSCLNISRFIRLIALSCTEMLVTVPLTSWALYYHSVQPFKTLSWADMHYDWKRVIFYVKDSARVDLRLAESSLWSLIGNTDLTLWEFNRWVPVFTAFLYFTFFGVQDEALVVYSNALAFLSIPFLRLRARGTGNR